MTTIEELLRSTRQVDRPCVPADVVPYDDIAYPDCASAEDLDVPAGADTARALSILCETIILRDHLGMDDFLVDDVPDARGAWILGCALYLAAATDDARFLWQYAAGVGTDIDVFASNAAYCLSLLHQSAGEHYVATFWETQTDIDTEPRAETIVLRGVPAPEDRLGVDLSTPTILRVLSRLTSTNRRSAYVSAILRCVAQAFMPRTPRFRDPEVEIPALRPGFARHIAVTVRRSTPRPPAAPSGDPGHKTLPTRPQTQGSEIKKSSCNRRKTLQTTTMHSA
ncbi:hypothetical protein [Streptomyces sp. NPDC002490]|uniref:hypothetical protein n=1 Tax=Streptomyces sp. NPDC002490 TaxID=3154416 RepID=UPI00332C9E5A